MGNSLDGKGLNEFKQVLRLQSYLFVGHCFLIVNMLLTQVEKIHCHQEACLFQRILSLKIANASSRKESTAHKTCLVELSNNS